MTNNSTNEFVNARDYNKLQALLQRNHASPLSNSYSYLRQWWGAGLVMCMGQGADLHMVQLMPLPLTISCSSKSKFVLPSWFYLSGTGSPG